MSKAKQLEVLKQELSRLAEMHREHAQDIVNIHQYSGDVNNIFKWEASLLRD